jgi:hypothetical protein
MKWICVGPQSWLQNGDISLTGGGNKRRLCEGAFLGLPSVVSAALFPVCDVTHGASKWAVICADGLYWIWLFVHGYGHFNQQNATRP